MRARNKIYHIDCFRCVACSRQLIPGDEFALRDDGLFCKADHEVLERSTPDVVANNNNNGNHRNYMNGKFTSSMDQHIVLLQKLSRFRCKSRFEGVNRVF